MSGMSATTDTFARFVDVLADTLDDHDASGELLASRLHLSRFYFDRLVSAAAGEPPATLRRRVLLERAAYRLITTDDDVLRIALDTGYSSHEAFTRAFARAYGKTPSRWRREPTRFQIEAPSKVHFNPPGGLRVPAHRKVAAMDLLTRMVEHHVWLVGEILMRAEGLSDDVLDEPVEISVEGIDDDPTLRSLLSRLVGQMAMWDAAPPTTGLTTSRSSETRASPTCGAGWPSRGRHSLRKCARSSTRGGWTRRSSTPFATHRRSSRTAG
jgi:AraC family transcriptional regulator